MMSMPLHQTGRTLRPREPLRDRPAEVFETPVLKAAGRNGSPPSPGGRFVTCDDGSVTWVRRGEETAEQAPSAVPHRSSRGAGNRRGDHGEASSFEQVLAELERVAAAHAHRVSGNGSDGVSAEALCSVRFDDLKVLKSRFGVDHRLARSLWAHSTCLARVFATMIADPDLADDRFLDEWAGSLDSHVLADALAVYASRTRFARVMVEIWIPSRDEWREHAGWQVLVQLALRDHSLSDAYFEHYLPLAERGFHATHRGVRGARSMALRTIGLRSAKLQEKATEVSRRLGLG